MIKGIVRYITFSVFLFAFMSEVYAEKTENYIFSKVDYQTGLSHSAVLSIFQDNSRLMWFGTYDGVNCYDGRTMDVFRADQSTKSTLSNNVIHSISQADEGCLWLNTHLGLDLFSPDMRQVKSVYNFNGDYSIYSNSRGDTYVICGETVFYYNTGVDNFLKLDEHIPGSGSSEGRAFVTESGELWYFPYDSGKLNVFTVSSFDSDSSSVRSSSFVLDFHSRPINEMFYQNGRMCFVDSAGDLYIYDIKRRSKIYIRNISELVQKYGAIGGIVPFYEDVIIGFRTNGLVRLKLSDKYSAEEIDRNIRIYGLFNDSEQGILWIATDGQGAVMYAREVSISSDLMLSRLSPNLTRPVRSILTDSSGGLWIGTKGEGIIHVPSYQKLGGGTDIGHATVYLPERHVNALEYVRGRQEFQVYTMLKSRYHDGFWAGSGKGGLYWFSHHDKDLAHVRSEDPESSVSEIHAIYEANDSILYLATADNGLHKVVVRKKGDGLKIKKVRDYEFYYNGKEIEMFYPMLPDGDSLLWLGSRGSGLVRYDIRTSEYQVISLKENLGKSVDDVLSLCRSSSGDLYVGTTSGLVRVRFDGGRMSFSYIGKEHGFLNDMIHGVLEDGDGFIWLSTNRGLIKYNPDNDASHTYYYSAGMSVGEFCDDAYYRCPYTGALLFGGVDGLLWLDSNPSPSPESYPDIVFRSLYVNRKRVCFPDYMRRTDGGEKTIWFKSPVSSFSLVFAVPDYLTGNDVEYSYILDGYDRSWSAFTGSSEASFTAVPPGKYDFRIRYKKDVFDTEFKSFSIPVTVAYPWYSSPVAKGIYALMSLSLLAFAGIVVRRRSMNAKSEACRTAGRDVKVISGHGMADSMSVIYECCDRLLSDGLNRNERKKAVDLIREALLCTFPFAQKSPSSTVVPESFTISSSQNIASAVQDVLNALSNERIDISGLSVAISDRTVFPVYVNAFRRIIYNCCRYVVMSGARADISAVGQGDALLIRFATDEGAAAGLNAIFCSGPVESSLSLPSGKRFSEISEINALRAILARLDIVCGCSGGTFDLRFRKAALPVAEGKTGKRVLFLTAYPEISWLLTDMLYPDYPVETVSHPELAVERFRRSAVSLFIADMRMFEGKEGVFVDLMKQLSPYFTGISFIPVFDWDADRSVYNEFIKVSDACITLPYDIPSVKSIVRRAVLGKGDITGGCLDSRVYADALKEWGIYISCPEEEDTEFVRAVLDIINGNLDNEELGTAFMASRMSMSESRFYRRFKKVFNTPPDSMIKICRLEKAASLLRDGASVMDVLCDIGISSRSYFYKEFANRFGMTPGDFKEKQEKANH